MNFLRIGFLQLNSLLFFMMSHVIFLVSVLLNLLVFGKKNDGYTKMIQGDDFSGIVDTIWEEEFLLKMIDKSKDGKL